MFYIILLAMRQAKSPTLSFRLSEANGEILNTDMCKDVSTPVGRST